MARHFGTFGAAALLLAAPVAQARVQTTGQNVIAVMVDAAPKPQYVTHGPSPWAALDTRAGYDWSVAQRRGDRTEDVEVGPLWSQRDAETKCAERARAMGGEWSGQWRTTVPGRMSVCAIRFSDRDDRNDRGRRNNGRYGGRNDGVTRDIEVGPIWNQSDAETKCRNKARDMRGDWTGQWRTTVQGRMSVCEIRFR